MMAAALLTLATTFAQPAEAPLARHPDNPRVFLFRGAPTLLVTSGEHYGAVLNLDFDFAPYLDELARCGLNLTRTFSGAYCEDPAAFNITENTLAPKPERYLCPWARSDQPGHANGGGKFDLARWDEAYFARLREFVGLASERGVVVEYVLFCPFYGEEQWALSPMNARNNTEGIGDLEREAVYTLGDTELQRVQEALVRKVVAELALFDNVYFEICNEPYFGGVTSSWQDRIADVLAEACRESGVPRLIARNIANGSETVTDPHPEVSILNFHYATPPDAVAANWDLSLPIADDETGFRGQEDFTYRSEAWEFLFAGGSAFSHLDYSFSPEHEDGSYDYPDGQPGGGSRALREQLGFLRRLLEGFDLLTLRPAPEAIASLSEGLAGRAVWDGSAGAVYFRGEGSGEAALRFPVGRWSLEWLSPATGQIVAHGEVEAGGGPSIVALPDFEHDIVLKAARAR